MINKTKFLILFLLTFVFIGFTSCTQGTQNPDDGDDDQPVHIVTNLDTPTELKVEIDDQYVTVSFEKVANAIMYEIVFENVTTNTTIKEKIPWTLEYGFLKKKALYKTNSTIFSFTNRDLIKLSDVETFDFKKWQLST